MPPKTERFEMRLELEMIARIDEWRRAQTDLPARAEAIRRLIEQSLAGATDLRPRSKGSRRKAAELASREIDRLGDQPASAEDRATRKRRLIKGPREFRDVRGDQPKKKD